ncbi:SpoIIE family protein phosphatase [Neptunomonas phycophila]|jgi:sigma-B regulation protein RsbU (phosphoserine phosphatase)|uniref:SpoIIE family protein phosphatase n=1 Tax=Neptunomonas phycophila TaxID=1572645 RepID=A0ABT9ES82_9GAMM|nr:MULTISPECIES: SpoIIE family protein phosphatase [Neptunomonas]MDN2661531.1 SpoIIE family protein phosphatase [Neptunomonas sp. CHC150]MDP2521836.1 SpoIIE family protein phosphatase [Neptunomonas phycophila]
MSSDVSGLIQIVNFSGSSQAWLQSVLACYGKSTIVGAFEELTILPTVRLNIVFIADLSDIERFETRHMLYSDHNSQGDVLADSPFCYETLAILATEDAALILKSLRSGIDDVFIMSQLETDVAPFTLRALQALRRCHLISEGHEYRESLEATLKELQDDQQAAYQLQKRILPETHQSIDGFQYDYALLPSLVASGDFVDIIPIDDHRTLFYVADVSGHGTSSALITVLLKNLTFRLLRNHRRDSSHDILSPLSTVQRMNIDLCALELDKHLTIFCGLIDSQSNRLTYTVGGHHPMPILKTKSSTRFLEGKGMPVGLLPSAHFEEYSITIDDVFSLTIMSDGVLELLPEGTIEKKESDILNWVKAHYLTLDAFSEFVFEETDIENGLPDDITIMSVSRV